jgi:uncharacterized protein with HEPN domain
LKINRKDRINILIILRYINDVYSYLKDKKLEELYYNSMLYDAICMKLFQIGEVSIRLSQSFKNSTKEIPWIKIKGFRNILAHSYLEVRIHQIIKILNTDLITLEKVLSKFNLT